MGIDITDIVNQEYPGSVKVVTSATLIGDLVEIKTTNSTTLYRMENGEVIKYTRALSETGVHLNKFKNIYRKAIRNKNIETLSDDL